MKLVIKLCLFILFCLPLSAMAELPEQIKKDFAPLSGYVIMPVGDEYLIDLDASVNLRTGDILTLVVPGEKVIHPVTKEVLGSLDVAKGYLQVTKIKSGYSYVKLLSADISPKKGDQIKRFEQVPAVFVSETPENALKDELRAGLSHIDWVDDQAENSTLLVFTLVGNTLTVKVAGGENLQTYQLGDDGKLSSTESAGALVGVPAAETSALNQAANSLLGSAGIGELEPSSDETGIIQSKKPQGGIWVGPNLKKNPIGLVVGDFDNDGKQETAVALENHLLIVEIVDEKMVQEADIKFASGTKLLSVDTIDMDADGVLEIYLSAASGTGLNSQVVEFREQKYQKTISRIPWFFRVAELPDGQRTLLAQTLGSSDDPFSEKLFLVNRVADDLTKGQSVSLPGKLNLFSFLPAGSAENEQLFAYTTPEEYLKVISSKGDEFWGSEEHFGGTDVSFYPEHNQNRELVSPVYIQQRLLKNSNGEILVVQNEGIRTFQRFREFKKSRIVAFNWDGFAMQESWRTSDQSGYLADFALADADNDGNDELVMVVKYQHKNFLKKGRSAIVIYELSDR